MRKKGKTKLHFCNKSVILIHENKKDGKKGTKLKFMLLKCKIVN